MVRAKKIVILNLPGSFQTAVSGLAEFFSLANSIGGKDLLKFSVLDTKAFKELKNDQIHYLIVPPVIDKKVYLNPDKKVLEKIKKLFKKKATICSVCSGAFIVASSGILTSESVTTHWEMEREFKEMFPKHSVNTDEILINNGKIIFAGGLMAWTDLAFHIIKRNFNKKIIHELGHLLVMNTSPREQRRYKKFNVDLNHPDLEVKKCQTYINKNYRLSITLSDLESHVNLTNRTLIRRFVRATGLTPLKYIQSIKIQKACELLESTNQAIEEVAHDMGYEDVGSFRKIFIQKMGVGPKEFRQMYGEK